MFQINWNNLKDSSMPEKIENFLDQLEHKRTNGKMNGRISSNSLGSIGKRRTTWNSPKDIASVFWNNTTIAFVQY